MRSSLKHILQQPFVVATGFAALVHSTWSLATLFAGHEPEQQFSAAWIAWVIPALLIALSLDLGQVVTAAEIRNGQRNRAKLATFGVFAVFTYGLQWYHLAHHAPLLLLADGVRRDWLPVAQFISDAMLWFVPALLPLSTLLYTFSSVSHERVQPAEPVNTIIAPMQNMSVNIFPAASDAPREIAEPATHATAMSIEASHSATHPVAQLAEPSHDCIAECVCGWRKVCDNRRSATNSLIAHQRHCEKHKAIVLSESGG